MSSPALLSSNNPFHPDNLIRSSSLSRVVVQSNVLHIMLAHALSTEKEEIMGMLMGDWVAEGPSEIARVEGVCLLTRSEKRKDRVEIAPEQLYMAAHEAEKITKETGRTTRVIGWYHSHPHITVFPSHVDLRTQLSQQQMDNRFIGMIVSCFNTDSELSNRIQITCFQSLDGIGCEELKLPFSIENENPLTSRTLPQLVEISTRIYEEQRQSFYKGLPRRNLSAGLTTPRNMEQSTFGLQLKSSQPKKANTFQDSSSSDWTRSSHAPNTRGLHEASPSDPTQTVLLPTNDSGDIEMASDDEAIETRLPSPSKKQTPVSFEDCPPEELVAQAIDEAQMNLPDRMTFMRNSGIYVQALVSLVDNLVAPTMQVLVDQEQHNLTTIKSLKLKKEGLVRQLANQKKLLARQANLVDLSD